METLEPVSIGDFPLAEFRVLSDAVCTWAVERQGILSGEIGRNEAFAVVDQFYPGGSCKFAHDWEKANRLGLFARERLMNVGKVDDGEERRYYYELDVSGLVDHVDAGHFKGRRELQNRRAARCVELRGTRAAWRLLRMLGMMPRESHSAYSPSGRWFHASTYVRGVRGCSALVETVSMLDC